MSEYKFPVEYEVILNKGRSKRLEPASDEFEWSDSVYGVSSVDLEDDVDFRRTGKVGVIRFTDIKEGEGIGDFDEYEWVSRT